MLSCPSLTLLAWNETASRGPVRRRALHRLAELVCASRRVESDLVANIAEVDERRLYSREAVPSMFAYCTDILHLSEAEAYLRITVARASRQHPVLLSLLADGSLHLTGIALLASDLTAENRDSLLRQATHQIEAADRGADRRPRTAAGRASDDEEAARTTIDGAVSARHGSTANRE